MTNIKCGLVPGGHVELDEDINQALVREVKEEVGLDVYFKKTLPDFKPGFIGLVPPDFMDIHEVEGVPGHRHMDMVYLMHCDSDQVVPGEGNDRSEEWKWFTAEEIENLTEKIWPEIKYFAKAALKKFSK